MADSWFDAYDSVGGQARFDTAAIPSTATASMSSSTGAGFWSTNGATLAKAAAMIGGLLLFVNIVNDRQRDVVTVRTVPVVTVTPAAPAPVVQVPVMVPQIGQAVTVSPQVPTPTPVVAVPSAGFGDLMENVCGNASTGYRMCRGSKRNAAQEQANWP